MFDHYNITSLDNSSPQQAVHHGHPHYPYPQSLTSEAALWAQGMKVYFQRMPDLVNDMENYEFGDKEDMVSAWVLMMFRDMCWSQYHLLIPGKNVPMQHCGSQLPVHLG